VIVAKKQSPWVTLLEVPNTAKRVNGKQKLHSTLVALPKDKRDGKVHQTQPKVPETDPALPRPEY
jgi:hypothetical protein